MTLVLKGVCPRCSRVTHTITTTADGNAGEEINYRVGQKCSTSCYGRKANQAPKVQREKK